MQMCAMIASIDSFDSWSETILATVPSGLPVDD